MDSKRLEEIRAQIADWSEPDRCLGTCCTDPAALIAVMRELLAEVDSLTACLDDALEENETP